MFPRDLLYQFPQAFFLIFFLIPFAYLAWNLIRYRQRTLQHYAVNPVLSNLLISRSSWITHLKLVLLSISWLMTCLALMSPIGNFHYLSKQPNQQDQLPPHQVIFLLDTSASMSVPDAYQGQTRLEEAKEIIKTMLSQLKGEQAALYAFTSELTPLVPATLDYLFFRLVLEQLTINTGDVGGTNFLAAFQALNQFLPKADTYSLIVLSDGGDQQLESLQGPEKERYMQEIISQVPQFPKPLDAFVIGLGSREGGQVPRVTVNGRPVQSQLQEDLLKALAVAMHGEYYPALLDSPGNLAYTLVNQMAQDRLEQKQVNRIERKVQPIQEGEVNYSLYYQVPLGVAILCLGIMWVLPDTSRRYSG